MTESASKLTHDFTDRTKYDALMEVVRNRLTTRAFDSGYVMPSEHYEMILEMQLSNSTTDEISYTFVAKGLSYIGEEPEEDEQLVIKKLPFEEVFQMAMRGEIRDGLAVSSILKAKLMIDRGLI